MERHPIENLSRRLRIIVVGAEDVAQHLRRRGHRVLSMGTIPERGIGAADAAVVELGRVDARSAQRFRRRLVEPILIHHRPSERPYACLSLPRRKDGGLNLRLLDDLVDHAVRGTRLLRSVEAEETCDFDAPTQAVTLSFAVPPMKRRTVLARPCRELGGGR